MYVRRKSYKPRKYRRRVRKYGRRKYRRLPTLAAEIKQYNAVALDQGVTTTPVTAVFCNITQGIAASERIGNQIKLVGLKMNCTYINDVDARFSRLRMVIVQDNQQVADTPPAWTDVFTSALVTSTRRIGHQGRFKVWMDKILVMSENWKECGAFKYFRKFNQLMRYNGAASTDLQKGQLYLMAVSDQGTGDGPYVNADISIYYIDN